MRRFDVVVLGAGSAGELIASTLVQAGKSVGLIEKLRIGGECAFVSCMPSKAMLRSAQARTTVKQLVRLGGSPTEVDMVSDAQAFNWASRRRDRITVHLDDSAAASHLEKLGVTLIRGEGVFTSKTELDVDGEKICWGELVISTGSTPNVPEIEGLKAIDYWSSEQALIASQPLDSVLIIGGGPVACELALIFRRFGSKVTVVELGPQLAGKEFPAIAERLTKNLREENIEIFLETRINKVEFISASLSRVHLSNGEVREVSKVISAAGRHPNTESLNLEMLEIVLNDKGDISVNENCRVSGKSNIWAAGDVTGIASFTHVANYQGQVICENILGGDRVANYKAIPRAIYTDPPISSVGVMPDEKNHANLITASFDLAEVSRDSTDGGGGGILVLAADPELGVLVGASAIGPHADEWMSEATLAIRAAIPLALLCDVVHPFPTYSQAFETPMRELLTQTKKMKAKSG